MGNHDLEAQLPMLRRISRRYARLSGCDADDLLHDAVLGVLEHMSRFDASRGSFSAFCRVWGLHGVRLAVAKRGRCASSGIQGLANVPCDVAIEEALYLAHALEQLPERARRVIVLRYADAMGQREIAEALGVSRDCVVRIEQHAVRMLKST